MNVPLTRLAVACGISGALILSTTSCSLLTGAAEEQTAQSVAAVRPAQLRVAQMRFGREAHFAACAEPACPAVTPKTLAQAPEAEIVPLRPPVVRVIAPADPVVVEPKLPPKPPRLKAGQTHVFLTFPFGSAALTDASKEALRRALPAAKDFDRIVISGRTDNVGSDEINQKLALARALAVRNYIRDVEPDLPNLIAIDGKGRCCFIAPNDSEGGRSRNRRVEVAFINGGA